MQRRTLGVLRRWQKKGTVKDVKGMMRHSRVPTTTDVYMQELPEGVPATITPSVICAVRARSSSCSWSARVYS